MQHNHYNENLDIRTIKIGNEYVPSYTSEIVPSSSFGTVYVFQEVVSPHHLDFLLLATKLSKKKICKV